MNERNEGIVIVLGFIVALFVIKYIPFWVIFISVLSIVIWINKRKIRRFLKRF